MHRNLSCSRYDTCLDTAVMEGWISWTCASCENFVQPANDVVPEHAERRFGE